jgi:hypothetical protein
LLLIKDPETSTLPRASSWLQYDYYDFVTHKRLRPPDPAGEKAFWSTIDKMRSKLFSLGVLGGLTALREGQIAGLTLDCIAINEAHRSFRKAVAAFRELSRVFGPRNITKIKEAAALLRLIAATGIDQNPNQPGVRLGELVTALDELVRQMPHLRRSGILPHAKWLKQIHPQPDDPTNKIVWELFSFLVHQCAVAKNEAEVRVGKIGNSYFGWDYKIREHYAGDERWKGCPAVRRRIDRIRTSSTTRVRPIH